MNTMIKIVADAKTVADRAALCSPSTPAAFGGAKLTGTTRLDPTGMDCVRTDRSFDRDRLALAGAGTAALTATAPATDLVITDKHISLGQSPPLST